MIFDTPDGVAFVQLCARHGALGLELAGMHRRGRSAYSICKSEYGLRGSRESVYEQVEAMVEAAIAAKQAERATLSLIDEDQGNCDQGHPCHLIRNAAAAPTGAPFLRECDTDHEYDTADAVGLLVRPYLGVPLARWDLTLEGVAIAAHAGAHARIVHEARSMIGDRE